MKNCWQFLSKILFLTLSLAAVCIIFSYEKQFQHHNVSCPAFFTSTLEIGYYVDGRPVGFVHCLKIPFCGHILYNFYVYPAQRGNGYAKELLLYACDLLKKQHAKRIFIQPGPFEPGQEVITDYQERLEKLVSLYTWCGFHCVSPVVSMGARIVYDIVGIYEDARYLMVMTF